MINRNDYTFFVTKNLYKVCGGRKSKSSVRSAFSVPTAMLQLMGLRNGGSVSVSMAKDASHIIIEPATVKE